MMSVPTTTAVVIIGTRTKRKGAERITRPVRTANSKKVARKINQKSRVNRARARIISKAVRKARGSRTKTYRTRTRKEERKT